MFLRISAFLLFAGLVSGCTWDGRPDGSEGVHTPADGAYSDEGVQMSGPEFGTRAEVIEPLTTDGDVLAPVPPDAPVDLTQPAPTTGTADATSEVEEALTPGTEQ